MSHELKTFRSVRIGVAVLFLAFGFAAGAAATLLPKDGDMIILAWMLVALAVASGLVAGSWLGLTKRLE